MTGNMMTLGTVNEMAHNGLLIVRAERAPYRNAEVTDSRNRTVGRVVRIFGPVRKPFVSVQPVSRDTNYILSLMGHEVYLKESKGWGRKEVYGNGKTQKDRRK
jgi:rRNA processing protein Gar1